MWDKLVSDKEHRRLLRKCGLPVSIADHPKSREEIEDIYPHLKMSDAEKEVRRIVNEEYGVNKPIEKCSACIELDSSISTPCQCLCCDPDGTRYICYCDEKI